MKKGGHSSTREKEKWVISILGIKTRVHLLLKYFWWQFEGKELCAVFSWAFCTFLQKQRTW
jgi:hypothetical protein